jgi:hypothetical protein
MPQTKTESLAPEEARPMRHLRPTLAVTAIMALLVACSSTPSASSGDGGGASQAEASTGGGASQPEASTGGGGGGGNGGNFANGSAKYHITGGLTADGELGFVPQASQVDNSGLYSLSFTDQANTVLVLLLSADSKVLSWTDSNHTIPGASCDWNISRQDANGAAGTFSCDNQPLFTSAGPTSETVDISGEFDAHK